MSNNNDDTPASLKIRSLADEVLRYILSYSDVQDLGRIESSCKFFHESLDTRNIWKTHCDQSFSSCPRYSCQKHGYPRDSYKQSYYYLYMAVRRTILNTDDLISLRWYFNFHPAAGGRGSETLVHCQFTRLALILNEYPPLLYTLEEGSEGESILQVADFPQHYVSRMAHEE